MSNKPKGVGDIMLLFEGLDLGAESNSPFAEIFTDTRSYKDQIMFKGRDGRDYPTYDELVRADDDWRRRTYIENTDFNKYQPEPVDYVRGPFYDCKLSNLGESTDWQTYYEVNGTRMSAKAYARYQEDKLAGIFGLDGDTYRKIIAALKEKQADMRISQNWLQSKAGVSQRAAFSQERSEFITENMSLAELLSLSPDEIEELRELLTAFDIFRGDAKAEAKTQIQQMGKRESLALIEGITHITGFLGDEDRFVLARIRADLLQGDEQALSVFEVFAKEVKALQDILSGRSLDLFFQDFSKYEDKSFNRIEKYIYEIINKKIDVRKLEAEAKIRSHREEYKAIQKEQKAKQGAQMDIMSSNISQETPHIAKEVDQIKDAVSDDVGRVVSQLYLDEYPRMSRYINGYEQRSFDEGKTWVYVDPKLRAKLAQTKHMEAQAKAHLVDVREKKSAPDTPIILQNPDGDNGEIGVHDESIFEDTGPVILEEPKDVSGEK